MTTPTPKAEPRFTTGKRWAIGLLVFFGIYIPARLLFADAPAAPYVLGGIGAALVAVFTSGKK